MLGRDDAASDSGPMGGSLGILGVLRDPVLFCRVTRVVLPLAAFLLRQPTAVPLAVCPEPPETNLRETESHKLSGADQRASVTLGRRRGWRGSGGSRRPAFLAPLNHVQGAELHSGP